MSTQAMTCRCIDHPCKEQAFDAGLCFMCELCYELGGKCALPPTLVVLPPDEPPSIHSTPEQMAKAIDDSGFV
jgi:hypothetical protein